MAEAQVLPQYIAGISAAMGSFALGSVIGWTSPAELHIKDGVLGFEVSNEQYGWIGSLMPLGAAVVCIPIGYVINIIGRKNTMLLLVPPFVLGWILIIIAKNVAMLYAARFLLGMCGGAFSITAPIYTTEIAETKIRGILGCFFQTSLIMGILYAYVMGAFLDITMNSICCMIIPILMAMAFLMLPESPAFFVLKGDIEEAQKSLQLLRGANYDTSAEMAELIAYQKYVKDKRISIAKSLIKKSTVRAFVISIALMIFQQFSGVNVVSMYSTGLFRDAETGLTHTTCTLLLGTMMLSATFLSLFFIDRAGRRPLLLVSSVFMSVCTFAVGYYFFIKVNNEEYAKTISLLPVICCCLYSIMFNFGFASVTWVIMAEVFSEDIKGLATAIAGTINWLAAFLVTNTYPLLSADIGIGPTFWLYTSFTIVAIFFVYFMVPETKGKTFLEIQNMLE